MHTGENITSQGGRIVDDPQLTNGQDRELWAKAKKRHIARSLLKVLAFAALIGAFWAFSDNNRLTASPSSHSVLWGACGATMIFVIVGGALWWQASSSPERYVSPLLGLEPAQRAQAKSDLENAQPAADPYLRQVELMYARQQELSGPPSRTFNLTFDALFIAVMVFYLANGDTALAALWAVITVNNIVGSELSYRRKKAAERFLAALR